MTDVQERADELRAKLERSRGQTLSLQGVSRRRKRVRGGCARQPRRVRTPARDREERPDLEPNARDHEIARVKAEVAGAKAELKRIGSSR
jgi:hypothetical protein